MTRLQAVEVERAHYLAPEAFAEAFDEEVFEFILWSGDAECEALYGVVGHA